MHAMQRHPLEGGLYAERRPRRPRLAAVAGHCVSGVCGVVALGAIGWIVALVWCAAAGEMAPRLAAVLTGAPLVLGAFAVLGVKTGEEMRRAAASRRFVVLPPQRSLNRGRPPDVI